MKKFLTILASLIALVVVLLALIAFLPVQRTPAPQSASTDTKVSTEKAVYSMQLADCAVCHTAEGGKPFAGGRPIPSPFGTIWSTNITPDPDAGIGEYTLDDFRAALYDGLRKDGAHLYPAMPYANYRMLSEKDVRSLYAFFMNEVEPVNQKARKTDLAFPFNQRWGIRLWKWAALPDPDDMPHYDDPVLDRGAHIVEALGHCGACHSPRNAIFGQAGFDARDADFLTGGEVGGWTAQDLRGPNSAPQTWSIEQMKAYLATGRNNHAAVAGEMSLVVSDSLQYADDDDIHAIATYLKHIEIDAGDSSESEQTKSRSTRDLLASADPSMDLGPRLYLDNCNACHFVDGQGANEVFPPLDGNATVTASKTGGLIDVILHGARLPSTQKRPAPLAMPAFGDRLSDKEVAELATFLRSAWSNDADPVTVDAVTARRDSSQGTDN